MSSPQHDGPQNVVKSPHVDRFSVHAVIAVIVAKCRIVTGVRDLQEVKVWKEFFDVV